jgi:hypothetical protein
MKKGEKKKIGPYSGNRKHMSLCPRCGKPCYYQWQTYHDRCLSTIRPEELLIDYVGMNDALDKTIKNLRESLSKRVIHIKGGDECISYLQKRKGES